MNKATVSAVIQKIKALEADGNNLNHSKSSREECRRMARSYREAFGLVGVDLS